MSGSNSFAIEKIINISRNNPSEYRIYEIQHKKDRFPDPVRQLVRGIHVQWPNPNVNTEDNEESDADPDEETYDLGVLIQERFSLLTTVVSYNGGRGWKFCNLRRLDSSTLEVLAELGRYDTHAIDEYYECEISDALVTTPLDDESDYAQITSVEMRDEGLAQFRQEVI